MGRKEKNKKKPVTVFWGREIKVKANHLINMAVKICHKQKLFNNNPILWQQVLNNNNNKISITVIVKYILAGLYMICKNNKTIE